MSYQPGYLKRKNANLDSVIFHYQADTNSFRNNSISTISFISQKHGVKLSEVPIQDPSFRTERFIIQKMSFEGDFFSLTKTLNELQQTRGIGVIRGVSFRLNRLTEGKLFSDVYIEILR